MVIIIGVFDCWKAAPPPSTKKTVLESLCW